jgi:hypothetical protein
LVYHLKTRVLSIKNTLNLIQTKQILAHELSGIY